MDPPDTTTSAGFPPGIVHSFGVFASIVTPVMVALLYGMALYQTVTSTIASMATTVPLNPVLSTFEPLFLGTMTGVIAWGLGQPKPGTAGSSADSQLHSLVLSTIGTPQNKQGKFVTSSLRGQLAKIIAVAYIVLYFGLAFAGGIVWYYKPDATPELVKTLPTLAVGAFLAAAANAVKT